MITLDDFMPKNPVFIEPYESRYQFKYYYSEGSYYCNGPDDCPLHLKPFDTEEDVKIHLDWHDKGECVDPKTEKQFQDYLDAMGVPTVDELNKMEAMQI